MQEIFLQNQWIVWLLLVWTLPWKAVALWRAAKNNHLWWFIAILAINTLAILEILYIFIWGKRRPQTTKEL